MDIPTALAIGKVGLLSDESVRPLLPLTLLAKIAFNSSSIKVAVISLLDKVRDPLRPELSSNLNLSVRLERSSDDNVRTLVSASCKMETMR